jgi:hypothetical protein
MWSESKLLLVDRSKTAARKCAQKGASKSSAPQANRQSLWALLLK